MTRTIVTRSASACPSAASATASSERVISSSSRRPIQARPHLALAFLLFRQHGVTVLISAFDRRRVARVQRVVRKVLDSDAPNSIAIRARLCARFLRDRRGADNVQRNASSHDVLDLGAVMSKRDQFIVSQAAIGARRVPRRHGGAKGHQIMTTALAFRETDIALLAAVSRKQDPRRL